jgi:hypothetical protein
MKKIIIITALFSLIAMASEPVCTDQTSAEEITGQKEINTDVPNHLKGATIIVRQADGRETSVPAEKFKVVPRKQQFVVTKTKVNHSMTCETNVPNKNRVSALGGYGAKGGLKSSTNGSVAEVESKTGAVLGLQYQRMITDRLSLGIQGQDNKTGSLVLGIDF